MKFREIRRFSGTSVRAACIRNNWYTRGDNDAYYRLLEMADSLNDVSHKTYMEGLVWMARDIYQHSNLTPCKLWLLRRRDHRKCHVHPDK